MQEFVRSLQGDSTETPLNKAQALMYQAFNDSNEESRGQLAHEALAICPDCADAYVLLAEQARTRKQALELYQKGVAAGERALGAESFQRAVGHFWGILETRPYMRCRLGLAHSLWTAGRREEAVQHLQDMLRLNPGDNQGVRYTLAGFLLFLDRDDDLAALLQRYPDEDSAAWAYTTALLNFRWHGDTIDARRLLKKAKKTNKHVPGYLLGDQFPLSGHPGHYFPGDENEALNYLGSFLAGWKDTPGAIAWLRANVKAVKKAAPPQPKGPLSFIKTWLKERLPQVFDVWQADFRQMPTWVRIAGEMIRPWAILVTSRSNDLVLAHQMPDDTPSAALLWDTLVQAMQHPAGGKPHRPTEIQVRSDEHWESLRSHVEEIGIGLEVSEELDQLDNVYSHMITHVCGTPRPGLLDVPGMKPEQVGSFFEAAASFFRQAPWKLVGYEAAIQVECDKFQSGPWYAVLMGQSGLTTGLALYEDLEAIRQMWVRGADEDHARETVGMSVTFGEAWDIPVADLEAVQKYGWEVARPDAYPDFFHKERGLAIRPPLVWELKLMDGCLRAIPEFLKRRKQDDPTREEITVTVDSDQMMLRLSWVTESEE